MRCNCFEVSLKKIFLYECFFEREERQRERVKEHQTEYCNTHQERERENLRM